MEWRVSKTSLTADEEEWCTTGPQGQPRREDTLPQACAAGLFDIVMGKLTSLRASAEPGGCWEASGTGVGRARRKGALRGARRLFVRGAMPPL